MKKKRNHNQKKKENKQNKLNQKSFNISFKLTFLIKNITIQNLLTAFIKCMFQYQKMKKIYQIIKMNNKQFKIQIKIKLKCQKILVLKKSINHDDNFYNKNYLFKKIQSQISKKYQQQQKQCQLIKYT
ncbi:hypothetical protein TTHERM_001023063 (macronuclear) [Tetrahymena thermophila SB210]|uniref:Uncharacterized protein n=1 Tax=Tetrahymena thermophila (strain SB210) TaxID=312017 RepID=W7XED1_TETTS|nr:hypothetical protein TTHERM_001023063 [Tetrahymena thermophila SB210]EWS76032.1 hypothetical protein TTHERM_001023063 [Tetrahymena thermophila SB210]|eukprot:XP_012651437.1 hypothetical protein TTHERM_001023063 [Tetrahymena thermophila SB210]